MERTEAIQSGNDKVEVLVVKKADVHDVVAVRMAKDLLTGEIFNKHQNTVEHDDRWDESPPTTNVSAPWLLIAVGYFFAFLLLSSVHPALAAAYFCLGFIAYFSPSFLAQDYRIKADWRYFCFPWMALLDYIRLKEKVEEI